MAGGAGSSCEPARIGRREVRGRGRGELLDTTTLSAAVSHAEIAIQMCVVNS